MAPRDHIADELARIDREAREGMLVFRPKGRTGRAHWARANDVERRRFTALETLEPKRTRLMVGGQTHVLDDSGVWRRWTGGDLNGA
jgi:hypothetical protein